MGALFQDTMPDIDTHSFFDIMTIDTKKCSGSFFQQYVKFDLFFKVKAPLPGGEYFL